MGIGAHSEDANMEGWWPLQDDAASTAVDDVSSNNRNGTLNGSGSPNTSDNSVTGPNSWAAKALQFDGSSDYVDLANVFSTILEATDKCTFLARVNPDALTGIMTILGDIDSGSGGVFFRIRGDLANDPMQFTIFGAFGSTSNTSILAATTWQTVAVTYDQTTVQFYDDASGAGSDSQTDVFSGSASYNTSLGARNNTGTRDHFFDGAISDVSIFSRALASGEITQWDAGPELNYVSGVSFSDAGVYDIGTWALPSPFASGTNGTATHEVIAVKADGTVLDSATTATGTLDLSANAGSLCYLLVRESNTGGYDIGDKATRTSSYGSANDGYYEIASVTAAGGGTTRRYSLTLMGGG